MQQTTIQTTLIIGIIVTLLFITGCSSGLDATAKCITEKGAKFYGASWCTHCAEQKKMFGTSFQYIDYVECAEGDGQTAACSAAGIKAYPTWIMPDGQKVEGVIDPVKLAKAVGCSQS